MSSCRLVGHLRSAPLRLPALRPQPPKAELCQVTIPSTPLTLERLSLVCRLWFPYSSFQPIRQPSIPSPVEEDTSKILDTTGTVIIQGPSIALLVWRRIMFNSSFLRVCRILRFVNKLDFAFLSLGGPSHGARVCNLGRVPKHRSQGQEVEGLLFSLQNSQLVHILSFCS